MGIIPVLCIITATKLESRNASNCFAELCRADLLSWSFLVYKLSSAKYDRRVTGQVLMIGIWVIQSSSKYQTLHIKFRGDGNEVLIVGLRAVHHWVG